MREIMGKWALDNDCFNPENFSPSGFVGMMKSHLDIGDRCLFVVAPDVVGDAAATLRRFARWESSIHGLGYPVAFVSQDGLQERDVPWKVFEAFFIGGTTDWKLSQSSVALARDAKARGKWLHVGRVNSKKRVMFCHHIGADSFDGTGWAIQPEREFRWALPLLRWLTVQPPLFEARIGG